MSDRFEQQVKQGLKESTQKSLAGWEFTPAMRQAVLTRIAEEEQAPEPVQTSTTKAASPRRIRRAIPQPVIWVAAAAAAFALALNIDWSMGGRASKSDQAPMSAASKPQNAEEAKAEMAAAKSMEPEVVAHQAAGAEETGAADRADGFSALAVPAGAPHLTLTPPESVYAREAPTLSQQPGLGIMSTMAVESMLDLAALPDGESVVLTSTAVRLHDATGGMVWEQQLSEPPMLMSASGGKIAVAGAETVQLFSRAGQPEGSLRLSGPISGLQLSGDGRLAVVVGDMVQVYNGTKLEFQTGPLTNPSVAFAPDGALAVTAQDGSSRGLSLFGRDGSRLAFAGLAGEGSGLLFADQGQVVVAGSQAFHRSGQPLWQGGLVPSGTITLGADGPILLWDLHQLVLLRSQDGTPLWTADFPGGEIIMAVASRSGEQVAVLGSAPEGPVLWVLTQSGTQRLAQRLTAFPADLAVEEDHLILLMPNGVERTPLP